MSCHAGIRRVRAAVGVAVEELRVLGRQHAVRRGVVEDDVDDDPQPGLVRGVDQLVEVLLGAEVGVAGGGSR